MSDEPIIFYNRITFFYVLTLHLQFTEWSCTTIRVLQATATCPNVHTDTNLFYNLSSG